MKRTVEGRDLEHPPGDQSPAMRKQAIPGDDRLMKVTEYVFSRTQATCYGLGVGVLLGIANTCLALDFTPRLELLGWLGAALLTVLLLHEGLHGAVGMLLGHRPHFGFEPPLVYTTFAKKIPRGHFIAIAAAPLLILNIAFFATYRLGAVRLFAVLCFAINTIGAMGDVWIALKLFPHERGTFIQDTKAGVEVWARKTAAPLTPIAD